MKRIIGALALALVLLAMPLVFAAPTGAQVTDNGDTSNYNVSAQSTDVNAGQVRNVDVNVTLPSQWWAGVFGTITEKQVLGDLQNNHIMFEWTLSKPSAGWVYLTTSDSFDFTNTATAGTSDVNAAVWQASSIPNEVNVETTFSATCSGAGNGVIPSGALATKTNDDTGSAYWETCVFKDASGNIAFAANVDTSGHNSFNGTSVNYQALVAAKDGASTTYYFFKG
jgi:hypothetical protein